MRRLTNSWNTTLSKLGFRKVSRSSPHSKARRTIGGYSRRLTAEPPEDRRMLAVLLVDTNLDSVTANGDLSLREAIAVMNFGDTEGVIPDLGRALEPGESNQLILEG